jgi:transglutaminase-like putative cysteine protease
MIKAPRAHSTKKLISQLLLLALPTALFSAYVLRGVNAFYSILENEWVSQGAYFTCGLFIAVAFYAFRFRFITTAAVLILLNFIIYKVLGSASVGEFDAFYFSVQFLIFSILFVTGWFVGFGFSRSRYFTIIWSVLMLSIQIVLLSKMGEITVVKLINGAVPVMAYTFYIIYTAELIRNMNEDEPRFAWFITKRLLAFSALLLIIFIAVFNMFGGQFQAIEKEWGGGKAPNGKGDADGESMTENGKNGGVKNKDQSKLAGNLSKDKQLIFVARLDNYFYDGRTPNPLYFTSHYYTKFDTATQTFETDPNMPYNDLFSPDVTKIPMYFRMNDQQIIKNSLGTKARKIINAEIYKVLLSPDAYLAPSTAFYCQPVTVPKEYRAQYKSAYSAKMWVSELNSAYFIYNPAGNYQLERFQEERFEKLREVKKIRGPDQKFMDYYTYMPKDNEYKKITKLTDSITQNADAPIDKIIAIRDYFLSKDEFNLPLFAYSDNPGIPGIPSANKLTYFLFENRKGYCAYFAGATLFMLRSLGIPSRVVAGYSITDRSSKNPGWYWFYQDQAHAWVQVYFQEYGWIDFDTTIPDVNTQQASQPDGTPPTDMPATYFVADGYVSDVDTIKKLLTLESDKILFHDTEYVSKTVIEMPLDASIATVSNDTGQVSFNTLKKGLRVTAVSHAEKLKDLHASSTDDLNSLYIKLPKPIPIDEIKIMVKEDKKAEKKKELQNKKPFNWLNFLKIMLIVGGAFIVLFFLSPWFIWMYFNNSARKEKAGDTFNKNRAINYYLNQLGEYQNERVPSQFSYEIDLKYGTKLAEFNLIHQKIKYGKDPITEADKLYVLQFYSPFIQQIKTKVEMKKRFLSFLNIYHTIHYYTKPKIK